MVKVYYNENSPNCYKVAVLLEELSLKHKKIHITFKQVREPAFANKFSNATVPAIEDGDVKITESTAILYYLTEKYGKSIFKLSEENQALVYQAMGIESSLILPTLGGSGIFGELGKPEKDRDMGFINRLMPVAQRIGVVLGKLLDDKNYFANKYSIADIQLYAAISKAVKHEVIKNPPSNIIRWLSRVKEKSAFKKASEVITIYKNI